MCLCTFLSASKIYPSSWPRRCFPSVRSFFLMLHHCLPSIFSVDLTFIFIWVQKRKVINKRLIFLVPERYLHAPNDLKLFPQCLPQKSKNLACFFLDCVKASAANIAIHHDAASFPRRWQKDPRTQSLRSTPQKSYQSIHFWQCDLEIFSNHSEFFKGTFSYFYGKLTKSSLFVAFFTSVCHNKSIQRKMLECIFLESLRLLLQNLGLN